jgi:SpoVK/Ycf46/Vps4 family AAA+-type ATPase
VRRDDIVKLTPYYQMLAHSRTRGYSLTLKKWLDFFIEEVKEIKWNINPFEKLVLPADQKKLILAFAETQAAGSTFEDIISDKDKGIICLLSGPPGVGKTLTAEATAEKLKVPLRTITSGDLGHELWEIEEELNRTSELVSRWNAITLLDECDVFLETRSTRDLARNRVVSIFLRVLEYYKGIMFMTTNNIDNIDPAFQSRIHISLEYPDLTVDSRYQIWKNFLGAATLKNDIGERELNNLAKLQLNGRQIKNILKVAHLLALQEKSVLKQSFIEMVLAVEKRRPGVQERWVVHS